MVQTPDELKKEREALIANHDTEQMTALLKETMDQSPPDSNLPHQERERILAAWRGQYFPLKWWIRNWPPPGRGSSGRGSMTPTTSC